MAFALTAKSKRNLIRRKWIQNKLENSTKFQDYYIYTKRIASIFLKNDAIRFIYSATIDDFLKLIIEKIFIK